MFIYLFIFFLIFFKLDLSVTYLYFFILYIIIHTQFNDFYLFLNFNKKTKKTYFLFKNNCYKTILLLQSFYRLIKVKLFWKPLFKKISYYGFYRNSTSNKDKK